MMSYKLKFLPMLVLLSACGPEVIREAQPILNSVKINEIFSIALEEDHNKGETWQMVKDVNTRAFENLGSNWHGSEKGVRFNLIPLHSGIYKITFQKTRMGEQVEKRSFLLLVKDS